jgi:protein TonB
MDDAVSDALHARTDGPDGLTKMLLVSAAAHIALMALAALAPASLGLRPIDTRSSMVTIDLGPAEGADSGGLTSMGARPVQRAVQDIPKVQPTLPPAAKTPDMTLPAEKPRVTTKPTPSVPDAPNDAHGRTPTVGREVVAGTAPNGAQSVGVGLSTRVGGGTGGQLTVGDFCCPEYIGTMLRRIHQHWNSGRGANAVATMSFTIQRDGTITDARLMRSSGNQMLDFLAERALLAVRQLPPLPDEYPHPTLVISLEFTYQR